MDVQIVYSPAPGPAGGANLLPYSDFQDADWTNATGFTFSGGVLSITNAAASFSNIISEVGSRVDVVAGNTYELSVTVSALTTNGRVRIFMDEFDGGVDQGTAQLVIDLNTVGSTGTYTGQITMQTGTDEANVQIESTDGAVQVSFDAISLVLV